MPRSSLSPDEIVLLSEEIQAIMAAGVPLEFGLSSSSEGMSQRLGTVARNLAARMEQGASLADAMAAERRIPESCRAILVAGIRCGHTEEVLEDVSEMSGLFTNLQQNLRQGMIYPSIVVVLSLSLFGFVVLSLSDRFASLYESLHAPLPGWMSWAANISSGVLTLILIGAAIVLLGALASLASFRGLSIFPGSRQLRTEMRLSLITHLLGTLLKYEVPLPEAVRLVANATAQPRWRRRLDRMATSLEQGEPLNERRLAATGFPSYLQWLIVQGGRDANLALALRQAADHYLERSRIRAEILCRVVPIATVLLVGGGLTCLYALSVFGPIVHLWNRLGAT